MELLADRAGAAWRRALACRSVSPEHLNGDAAHFQPGRIFRSSLVVHLLVLSGCHSRADIAKASSVEVPDYVADSVADLAACL